MRFVSPEFPPEFPGPQRALSPDKNEELNLAEFQPVRDVRYTCPEFDAVRYRWRLCRHPDFPVEKFRGEVSPVRPGDGVEFVVDRESLEV